MHRTKSKLRTLVWGTLLALLVSGLPTSQAQDVGQRPGALIVPIGGTVRLQMKSKKPIKTVINPKENVINIRTVVGDPTTLLITGQTPDVTTLELTDVDDKKESLEVIVQLDIEYLKTQLRRAVPTANITPIPSSNNAVILTGTVARAEDVNVILQVAQSIGGIQVINAMRVGGVMQVQLDVVVVSVSRETTRAIGFDFVGNARNVFFGNFVNGVAALPGRIGAGGDLGVAANGLLGAPAGGANFLFGIVHGGWNFLGFLSALRTEGLAKFLAQPSLVTLSGRPATFLVGGDQAVPVVGGIAGNVGVQFEPFGTTLTFLPIVLGNGKIHMEVSPSVTSLNAAFGVEIAGNIVPGRSRSSVNTTVQMESGQTFVIGGLVRHETQAASRRTPLLGDVPFFDTLWGGRNTRDLEEELIILVTPHLVDPQDCNQVTKVLPGQETRLADDFELFLEGILEAPRGSREVFQQRRFVPAYKNSPSMEVFPCAGGPGGCADGRCGAEGVGLAPAIPPLDMARPGPNSPAGMPPAQPVMPAAPELLGPPMPQATPVQPTAASLSETDTVLPADFGSSNSLPTPELPLK